MKKNYLLIMPRIVNKVGDGYSFPLGLPYVSASMKKAGFHIFTCNLNHHKGEIEEIVREELLKNKIDVVFTGGLSFQYYPIKQLIDAVKAVHPEMPVCVGGGVITGDPEAAMDAFEGADIGIIGEGERTNVELCRVIEGEGSLLDVDGLIFKDKNGSYIRTKERTEIEDIDTIPWPDYDGFELEKSFDKNPGVSGLNFTRTIFMLGSRSCPYQCSFCFHTVGKKYRQRSLDDFFKELEYNINRYKINFVCIADELFSYSTQRVVEFCQRIEPYHIKWWAQFRVDSIEPQILPIILKSGCTTMSFGLESADNRVLKSMRKNITIEQIHKTLSTVYAEKIPFEGAFIFGDDAETYETALNTLKYWEEHAEYKINLNTITVFPGCLLYKNAKKNGQITDAAQYLKDGCPQMNNTKMTLEEYKDIMEKITDYPFSKTKIIKEVELLKVDYENGRIAIKGRCPICGEETIWSEIKLFATNFLACSGCGQRYNILIPKELTLNLGRNIEKLYSEYGEVAVWGVNYHTTKTFEVVEELNNQKVFPIDSSLIKQQLTIGKRKVNAPSTIREREIKTVVIAIPAYYNQIELQIKYQYPKVERILDICDLLRE
ncbi:MAG: cobalamin-dependent protein [Lachnospiraceae bacterium]